MKRAFMPLILLLSITLNLLSCANKAKTELGETSPDITSDTKPITTPNTTLEATFQTSANTSETSENVTSEPPTDTDIVSSLALRDFLPLTDYSWEREYPAEYVVVHFSSNVVIDINNPYSLEGVRNIFKGNYVSTNYVIDRDGTIYCWIPEQRAAWHAGKGSLNGNEKYENRLNKYSIGIELLAMGSKKDMNQYLTSKQYDSIPKEMIGYTDAQYKSLTALLKDITSRWDIIPDREHIIGHDEYNPSKTDPGELFDWNRIMNGINQKLAEG